MSVTAPSALPNCAINCNSCAPVLLCTSPAMLQARYAVVIKTDK